MPLSYRPNYSLPGFLKLDSCFAGRNSRPTEAGSYERVRPTLRSDQRGMAAWPSLSDR